MTRHAPFGCVLLVVAFLSRNYSYSVQGGVDREKSEVVGSAVYGSVILYGDVKVATEQTGPPPALRKREGPLARGLSAPFSLQLTTARNRNSTVSMTTINSTFYAAAHAASSLLPLQFNPLQARPIDKASTGFPAVTIDPWSIFDKVWTATMGYSTQKFRYEPGITPMSTFKETAIAISLYYIIIFGGREIMRNYSAFKLNGLFIIHNFYLTVISGALLILFAQELIPGLWKNGLFDGICGSTGWSQNLMVLYYLNYLTKYLELLDTVFLVLKKKPLTFLHTYHHGATALLCYTQLSGRTSVSWVPITLNLAVHVVMYW